MSVYFLRQTPGWDIIRTFTHDGNSLVQYVVRAGAGAGVYLRSLLYLLLGELRHQLRDVVGDSLICHDALGDKNPALEGVCN